MNDLKASIIQNNLIKLQILLDDNDIDINSTFETGWSCLMYACNNARVEIIKFLLDKKADAKMICDYYTCLMIVVNSYAADVECADCLRLLIQAGAEVDYQDRIGKTAFLMSIDKNKIHCASTLLELNANPNILQLDGNTALMIAVKKRNLEMVKLLLNLKGNSSINPKDKENALLLAKSLNYTKIADLLSLDNLLPDNSLEKLKFNEIQIRNIKPNDISAEIISDFDLFLIANDIENLKSIFEKYSIDGTSFSTLTEDDFIKMNIQEPSLINHLMKIVSKISHSSSRSNKNIDNTYKNYSIDGQNISCCECVDIIKSTKEQFAIALSCVSKLHNEFQYKNIVTTEMDVEHLKSLDFHLNESIQNVLTLKQDLAEIQAQLIEIYGNELPDLHKLNKKQISNFKYAACTFMFTVITASASIILFYLIKK